MRDNEFFHLTGYLFAVDQRVTRENLTSNSSIVFRRPMYAKGWEEYEFHSPRPLLDDEELREPPYVYKLVCRRTGVQFALLARAKKVVDYLWENDLRALFGPQLSRVSIKIDELVRLLSKSPDRYVLSTVYARVPAFGESLRAISFYGDDIAEAVLFRQNISLLNCYTCGVRDVVGGPEIVRLGTDGYLYFAFTGANSIKRVDQVLLFVVENDLMYG